MTLGPLACRLYHCGGWRTGIMGFFAGVICRGHKGGMSGQSGGIFSGGGMDTVTISSLYDGAAGFKRLCNVSIASMVLHLAGG